MNSDPPPPSTRRALDRPAESLRGLRELSEFSLQDVDAVRLILKGDSVIDWHRLNLTDRHQAAEFIRNHELDPDDDRDVEYITALKEQAIGYLRRNFGLAFPKPVQHAHAEDLVLMASGSGHRQQAACTVLKAMQIINHTNGRELLFRLPVSDRDLFHLVEEKVYRVVGTMLSEGFPITEFVGGRKNLDSTYTKLLSKPESSAVALYDKLRFRIVTRQREDLLPILLYLSERLFPFNYVVPKQSTNTMFHFRSFCEA
ncbi:MAG TPA: TIGR04552 family protein, partial [Polyangiaceae bacterium]|nr:TIGR04552 family protein [Polyangiaceae bacterium]